MASIVSMAAGVTADIANMKIQKGRLEGEIAALGARVDATQQESLRLACESNETNDHNKKLHDSLDNYLTQSTHVKCLLQSVKVVQTTAVGKTKEMESTLMENKGLAGNLASQQLDLTQKQQVELQMKASQENAEVLRGQQAAHAHIIKEKTEELRRLSEMVAERQIEESHWLEKVARTEAELVKQNQCLKTLNDKALRCDESTSKHLGEANRLTADLATAKAVFESNRQHKSDELDAATQKLQTSSSENAKLQTSNDEKDKSLQSMKEDDKRIDEETKTAQGLMMSERRKKEETVQSLMAEYELTDKMEAEAKREDKELSARLADLRSSRDAKVAALTLARANLVSTLDSVASAEDDASTVACDLDQANAQEKRKTGEHLARFEKSKKLEETLCVDETNGKSLADQYSTEADSLAEEINAMALDVEARSKQHEEDSMDFDKEVEDSQARLSALQTATVEASATATTMADSKEACEQEYQELLQEKATLETAVAEAKSKATLRLKSELQIKAAANAEAKAGTERLDAKQEELVALKTTLAEEDGAFLLTLEEIKNASKGVLDSAAQELAKLQVGLAAAEGVATAPKGDTQSGKGSHSPASALAEVKATLSEAKEKKKAAKSKITKQTKATAKLKKQLTKAKGACTAAENKMSALNEDKQAF